MLKTKKDKLNTLLIEAVLIIFAVMIGFIVNEWRENIDKSKKTTLVKDNILLELKNNKAGLSQTLEKQILFHDSLKNIINSNRDYIHTNTGFIDILVNIKTELRVTPISMPSWEAAKNSGVLELLEYDLLSKMSETNEMIMIVNKISERLVDNIYHKDAFDKVETGKIAKMVYFSLYILINAEKQLMEKYDSILAMSKD